MPNASQIIALFSAMANAEYKEAEALLAKGVDINSIRGGETLLTRSAYLGTTKATQWLLQHGADCNLKNAQELTPLMVACSVGKVKGSQIARLLIAAGCNVRYRRSDEMSALEFAVKEAETDIIRTLVERGLPVNGPKKCKQTPAMHAARYNNVDALKTLVALGCDLSLKCGLPWAKGKTCLELAEMENSQKAVKYLRGLKK